MITAVFRQQDIYASACGLWQWDYGQILRIQGLKLPPAVEIHFSLQETGGAAVTRVGVTRDGVTDVPIPDSMLEQDGAAGNYDIFAFLYLTDEISGQTEYKIRMTVKARPKPEAFNTPEDTELFREAVRTVNNAASRAEGAEISAEAWAHGHPEYPDREEDNAAYYAGQAADSQEAAAASEEAAQVSEKSAQTAFQSAELSADRAARSATEAYGYMDQAQTAAENALLSEQAAREARTAAENARAGAEAAEAQAETFADQAAADKNAVEAAKSLVIQTEQDAADNQRAVEQMVAEFGVTAQRAVDAVNTTGQEQIVKVESAGADQLQAVNTAGQKQVQAVKTESAAQVQAVESEGTVQVANVQAAAAEVEADRDQIEINRQLASSSPPGIVNTAEGRNIVVKDSSERPFQGLKVFGKSIQQKTAGTNLCNWRNYPTTTRNGITLTADSEGVVTLSGTPTVDNGYVITVFCDIDLNLMEVGNTYISNEQLQIYRGEDVSYTSKLTLTDDITQIRQYIQKSIDNYVDGEIIKPMLNAGSAILPWEPYTGGAPSPSLEYPQELVSLGPSINTDFYGKNLVNLNDFSSDHNNSFVVDGDTIIATSSVAYGMVTWEIPSELWDKELTFSGNSLSTEGRLQVVMYDADLTQRSIVNIEGIGSVKKTFKITDVNVFDNLSNVKIKAYAYKYGDAPESPQTCSYSNIMLSLSDTDEYEPYKDVQILPSEFANGLPGIPVSSGGNYTDENGQQWIANYRDWGRGVDVKLVNLEQISKTMVFEETKDVPGRFAHYSATAMNYKNGATESMSNFSTYAVWGSPLAGKDTFAISNRSLYYAPMDNSTVDEVNERIAALTASASGLWVLGQLATPIETPIPAEELASYRALHTNFPTTTITNDAGAYMEVSYIRDPRIIQQEIKESIEEISGRLGNISFSINAEDGGLDLIYEQEVHNV